MVYIYPALCYILLMFISIMNFTTKPRAKSDFCQTLNAQQLETYRRFHWYISAPTVASGGSNLLNLMRFIGLLWAIGCPFFGHYWLAGSMALYFVLSGMLIANLSPDLYWAERAEKGDKTAAEQMILLEQIKNCLHDKSA